MSIAHGAKLAEMERSLLEISRMLTDTQRLVQELEKRLAQIETKPRAQRHGPGPL